MARSPKTFKRYAWDSCSWIAGIWREVITVNGVTENRGAMCESIISDAEKGGAEIYTSALTFAEVCKHPKDSTSMSEGADKLKAYFENDYIVIVPLDRRVGELARELLRQGHQGLKPLDATHLASALVANVDELHTFDDKLLNLDGKLIRKDGEKLKICKPSMGGPPLPLLDAIEEPQDKEATLQAPRDEPQTRKDSQAAQGEPPVVEETEAPIPNKEEPPNVVPEPEAVDGKETDDTPE